MTMQHKPRLFSLHAFKDMNVISPRDFLFECLVLTKLTESYIYIMLLKPI